MTHRWKLSLLLSAIGAALAGYLSTLYYSSLSGESGFKALCDINDTFSCQSVITNQYGEILGILPVSTLAFGYYLWMMVLIFFVGNTSWKKVALTLGMISTSLTLLFSLWLVWVMVAIVKVFCPFCLALDAINLTLFLIFFVSARQEKLFASNPLSIFSQEIGKVRNLAITFTVLVFVSSVILRPSVTERERSFKRDLDIYFSSYLETPEESLTPIPGANTMGAENSPIKIVTFSDYECPHCKRAALILKNVESRYAGNIQVSALNFPLDQKCNPQVKSLIHEKSCDFAMGSICASKLGFFKNFHEGVFEQQEVLNSKQPTDFVPADKMSAFQECLKSPATKVQLDQEIALGNQLKITSTPTIFVQNKRIQGIFPMEYWNRLIPYLLNKK